MSITRRQINLSLLAAFCGAGPAARAQSGAERLRLLCGYPAGGSVDVVSRKIAERLSSRGGMPALVENRPGAAGRLAVLELVKAPRDGRTLLVTPASIMTMYPHVYAQLGYDVFADVQPVCTVAATNFAFAAGPKVPPAVTDMAGFLGWCKANPAAAQCGNAGAGSMPHFMAILLSRESRIPIDHIPYRGGSVAMQACAAGEVASALGTESSARALSEAGKLRVLATSGSERTAVFPQAPTFRELGLPALVQREWFGVFAPGGTPQETVSRAAEAVTGALNDAGVRETWEKTGLQVDALPPEQLRAAVRREHDFWGPLIRESGFKPES